MQLVSRKRRRTEVWPDTRGDPPFVIFRQKEIRRCTRLYGPGGSHETPSPLRACGAGGAQRKSRATKRGRGCFVNPAVDDDQSKSADAVDDASGPFVHACYCGRWGFFGYEVALLKYRTGTWFCAEHRPGDNDQTIHRGTRP